ncbi:MAG: hypothetical protein ACP5E3_14065 [Bacteroidales bacterium]
MKIANKKETYRIWLQKFVATLIYAPLVLTFSFSKYFNQPFLGLEREWLIIIITVLYLVFIVYHHLLNPYFIFYSDNGDKIQLRYYPVRAFNRKKKSFVIPKDKLVKFESQKTTFGEKIIIYQQFKKGIGKYPAVSLTGLSEEDRKKIKASLLRYSRK